MEDKQKMPTNAKVAITAALVFAVFVVVIMGIFAYMMKSSVDNQIQSGIANAELDNTRQVQDAKAAKVRSDNQAESLQKSLDTANKKIEDLNNQLNDQKKIVQDLKSGKISVSDVDQASSASSGSVSALISAASGYVGKSSTGWEFVQSALKDAGYGTVPVSSVFKGADSLSSDSNSYKDVVDFSSIGKTISPKSSDDYKAGDIIEFGNISSAIASDYMGIYVGNGKIVASENGKVVSTDLDSLSSAAKISKVVRL
ncbi:MAG: C40 family peptidase [Candidatus Ancillula sp.]|nr:C40 family peptidase [Candidatus Ancillula sp.]